MKREETGEVTGRRLEVICRADEGNLPTIQPTIRKILPSLAAISSAGRVPRPFADTMLCQIPLFDELAKTDLQGVAVDAEQGHGVGHCYAPPFPSKNQQLFSLNGEFLEDSFLFDLPQKGVLLLFQSGQKEPGPVVEVLLFGPDILLGCLQRPVASVLVLLDDLALADYLDPANTGNLTGLTVADVPALAGIGRVPFTFTLTLSGTPVAPALEAVQLSLELPAGVRIAEDSSGPLVEILGSALSVDTLLTANYVPETGLLPGELTLALLVPAGLTEGDILRVSASALGASPPQIPDFSVFIDSAKDGNGADLVLGGAAVSALAP